jgi:hypothetical protein
VRYGICYATTLAGANALTRAIEVTQRDERRGAAASDAVGGDGGAAGGTAVGDGGAAAGEAVARDLDPIALQDLEQWEI